MAASDTGFGLHEAEFWTVNLDSVMVQLERWIDIGEGISWDGLMDELVDLALFPHAAQYGSSGDLVIDLMPGCRDGKKLLILVHKCRPDLIRVRITRQALAVGLPLMDVYLKWTCKAIRRLVRQARKALRTNKV